MSHLAQHLLAQADSRGDTIAVVHCRTGGATATTWRQLAASAQRFASAFVEHAASASILPLYLGKSPDCIAAMFGALLAGKAFACLNKKLRAPQIEAILRSIGPTLGLTDTAGLRVLAMCDASSIAADMPWWLVPEAVPPPLPKTSRITCVRTWPVECDAPLPRLTHDPLRVGCCLFTSGSTGAPKGVLIAESDLAARARAEIECFGIGPRDVLLSILPFSFDVGLNQLLTAIVAGCTLVLLDSWLPADILRASAENRVTGISGVPAIWLDMQTAGARFDTTGAHRSLRYITVSGGDLPPDRIERLPLLAPGAGIFKTYGQTEAFRATALRPEDFAAKFRSVGRPFGSARIYVLRPDGNRCEANEEGEIVHSGLGTMLGYLGDRDAAGKLRPNPFHGLDDGSPSAVYTGDLGYFDEDGFLYVNGRRDDMLKVAGNRVYPGEIVGQMLSLADVADACVVGVKDASGQTALIAFAAAREGAVPSPDVLRRELSARLPSYMVPREIIVLPSLPRTASGKPDVPAMAQRAAQLVDGATVTSPTGAR